MFRRTENRCDVISMTRESWASTSAPAVNAITELFQLLRAVKV
jgi:hypothetical protein